MKSIRLVITKSPHGSVSAIHTIKNRSSLGSISDHKLWFCDLKEFFYELLSFLLYCMLVKWSLCLSYVQSDTHGIHLSHRISQQVDQYKASLCNTLTLLSFLHVEAWNLYYPKTDNTSLDEWMSHVVVKNKSPQGWRQGTSQIAAITLLVLLHQPLWDTSDYNRMYYIKTLGFSMASWF